jgi:uncharacterized protein YdiU (UPF0061 family)
MKADFSLMTISFDNSYARLPERFFARLPPTPVAAPRLLKLNTALAEELGLDPAVLASPDGVAALAGNLVPEGAEPIAQAYAGHQFGGFSPQLGDGRAILLGEVIRPDGARRDIQLKGSGPTPWSRRGDGRAGLGPVLREYIISEAMAALGIPTTRSLAVLASGEEVYRETPVPGAVLTRIAASHIRVGTFQYFAARGDEEALSILAEYARARHHQQAEGALGLLRGVVAAQAGLVARWMLVGFIHGVMNTDNMTISGETIDYGPCAFMDGYDPAMVLSSIDYGGRYAYANQPKMAHWNLCRLAEALLAILPGDEAAQMEGAQAALAEFAPAFHDAYLGGLSAKLGLPARDDALAQGLLALMAEQGADFTLTFRGLCDAVEGDDRVRGQFADPSGFDAWAEGWRAALAGSTPAAAMRALNPAFIPRNHQVERAIAAGVERADFGPFEALLSVLARPFDDQPGAEDYAAPPQPEERVLATFCGT